MNLHVRRPVGAGKRRCQAVDGRRALVVAIVRPLHDLAIVPRQRAAALHERQIAHPDDRLVGLGIAALLAAHCGTRRRRVARRWRRRRTRQRSVNDDVALHLELAAVDTRRTVHFPALIAAMVLAPSHRSAFYWPNQTLASAFYFTNNQQQLQVPAV